MFILEKDLTDQVVILEIGLVITIPIYCVLNSTLNVKKNSVLRCALGPGVVNLPPRVLNS